MAEPLNIHDMPIAELAENPRNARTHTKAQIAKIADSIRQFGFTNPILIDDTGMILAGHGRLAAARSLGYTEVPVIRLSDMSAAEKRAYVIADNRLAERAGWDREILAEEFQALADLDLEFDLEITGFDSGEIDLLIEDETEKTAEEAPAPPPAREQDTVSTPGDLWCLGRHRLLCGDARKAGDYARLLGDKRAQMVFTDPPYNVPIAGHARGLGQIQHGDFAVAAGEMSDGEFTAFLSETFGHLAARSKNGAIHYICMDWRHIAAIMSAARDHYREFKNLCVWNKSNAGMGAFYRSKHELVFVFKSGKGRHINNFGLGENGRGRSNVWDYAGANVPVGETRQDLNLHPTVKPVALVKDAILDCSKRSGIILDPFCGSGTTILAATLTGRLAYAMEIDPAYADVAVRRWQSMTGEAAIHAETGRRFDDAAFQAAKAQEPNR